MMFLANRRQSLEEQEEHRKGEPKDSCFSYSNSSCNDNSEHSAKSDPSDTRNSGGVWGWGGGDGEKSHGGVCSSGGGRAGGMGPTRHAYPVQENVSKIFTQPERILLMGIANKYDNIICEQSNAREISLEEQNAWKQIAQEYNSSHNIVIRSEMELRRCWYEMKSSAYQPDKDIFKVEVNAEDEHELDIKIEPLDLISDFEAVTGDAWQCGELTGEEEREPALKETHMSLDNTRCCTKEAEKEMFKMQLKAEDEGELDIKMEPLDFTSDMETSRFYGTRSRHHDVLEEDIMLIHDDPEDTVVINFDVQKKFGMLKSAFQHEVKKTYSPNRGLMASKSEYFKTCSSMPPHYHSEPRSSFTINNTEASPSDVLSVSKDGTFHNVSNREGAPLMSNVENLITPSSTNSPTTDEASFSGFSPSVTSSSDGSEPSSPALPHRKKRNKPPQPDNFDKTPEKVKSVIGNIHHSDSVVQATTDFLSGYMYLLPEKEQHMFANKIIKLVQEHLDSATDAAFE